MNDYPTSSFYRNVHAAAEQARDRGVFLDLTLGSGWPFGGGEKAVADKHYVNPAEVLPDVRKAVNGAVLGLTVVQLRRRCGFVSI